MALHKKTYDLCRQYFKPSLKIVELGAQYIMGEEWGSYGPPYFKDTFTDLDLTSFDITGENNSLIVNLSNPLPEIYKGQFDIVTNFGTTEHVQEQFICWQNIFDMVKVGGLVINEIPKKGNWPGHCKYYFDEKTFESLYLDFEIVDMQDRMWEGNGNNIYCVLKKNHSGSFRTSQSDFISNIEIITDYQDGQGR
jgi:hypothetical protein